MSYPQFINLSFHILGASSDLLPKKKKHNENEQP